MTPLGRGRDEFGLRFVLGETPLSALALGGVRTLRATCRRMPWPTVLIAVIGALGALGTSGKVDAQPSAQPQINVARTIVAEPASRALLGIEISPPETLPKKSFVSLRGLPPSASLTEGHAIGPGSWAVPLVALPTLKVNIPAGISGRADIVISLIGMDGRLLAEARTALVVGSAAMILSQEKAPAEPPHARFTLAPVPAGKEDRNASGVVPQPSKLSAEETARAERLLAQGEKYLANLSIEFARQFFLRAAEAGLAAAALRLAATYDPVELQRLQALGVVPDRALARQWYERAREISVPQKPKSGWPGSAVDARRAGARLPARHRTSVWARGPQLSSLPLNDRGVY